MLRVLISESKLDAARPRPMPEDALIRQRTVQPTKAATSAAISKP